MNSQTSGRDISRTITNPTKIFSTVFIHITIINLRNFSFLHDRPFKGTYESELVKTN